MSKKKEKSHQKSQKIIKYVEKLGKNSKKCRKIIKNIE